MNKVLVTTKGLTHDDSAEVSPEKALAGPAVFSEEIGTPSALDLCRVTVFANSTSVN